MKKLLLLSLIVLSASACGGSGTNSSSPNTSTRALSGSLNLTQLSTSSQVQPSSSVDDSWKIIFTDDQGSTHEISVDDLGAFRAELEIEREYEVEIEHGNVSMGVLQFPFDSQNQFTSTTFHLSSSSDDLQLGEVECEHGVCSSTINPRSQCDRDSDGINDLDDSDELDREDRNHDGRDDSSESESGHHGSDDDSVSHSSNDDSISNDCELIRSNPYNNQLGFEVDKTIRLRFSNAIDTSTITDSSIQILNDSLSIPYLSSVENEEEHGDIRINPIDDLSAATTYQIRISTELTCTNGAHPAEDSILEFTTRP